MSHTCSVKRHKFNHRHIKICVYETQSAPRFPVLYYSPAPGPGATAVAPCGKHSALLPLIVAVVELPAHTATDATTSRSEPSAHFGLLGLAGALRLLPQGVHLSKRETQDHTQFIFDPSHSDANAVMQANPTCIKTPQKHHKNASAYLLFMFPLQRLYVLAVPLLQLQQPLLAALLRLPQLVVVAVLAALRLVA